MMEGLAESEYKQKVHSEPQPPNLMKFSEFGLVCVYCELPDLNKHRNLIKADWALALILVGAILRFFSLKETETVF